MIPTRFRFEPAHAMGSTSRHLQKNYNRRALIVFLLLMALTSCHTSRHVVTHVDEKSDNRSVHQEQAMSSRLDSLFLRFSASADSITVLLYGNPAPDVSASASLCGATSTSTCGEAGASLHVPAPDALQGSAPSATSCASECTPSIGRPPTARVTIHSPRISKEERCGSNTIVQTNMADSTRSNTEAHTNTDDSKESIGVAEPPKLTWVFIVLGLGITLLLVGAIFGYLWLHKKGVI